MASVTDPLYGGSRILSSVADYAGLPLDQINFVASQLVALLLAPMFRSTLHPSRASPATRQTVCLLLGVAMGWFCFGQNAIHLAGLPTVCYLIMRIHDPRTVQRTVLVVSMLYLSLVHLYIQFIDQSNVSVDITGPMMVVTQKVTSLAFSIHDGSRKDQLTPMQSYHAVKKLPSPLEFFSFVFQFQTFLAGPLLLYNDYTDFITGATFAKYRNLAAVQDQKDDGSGKNREMVLEPSPTMAVRNKVASSLACVLLFLWLLPHFPMARVKESEFLTSQGIPGQIIYLIVATSVVRLKYYHAWLLADAISNASGLGLEPPSTIPGQEPGWDLISNVDVLKFEMGLSLRDSVAHWNKGTSTWLRLLAYERCTKFRTLQTYTLSALWHGFHPGYYLTFLSGALFTIAGRSARKCLRHHFTSSGRTKHMYDCTTFIATRVLMGYVTFPFVLLELKPCLRIYSHMYWWYHLAAVAAVIILPILMPPQREEKRSSKDKMAAGLGIEEDGTLVLTPLIASPSVRRRHLLRDVVLADRGGKLLKLNSTALVTE